MRVSLTRMKFLVSLLITGSMGLVLTGCHFGETPAPPEAPRTDPLEYHLRPGDLLNIEVDVLAKYAEKRSHSNITMEALKAEGF